MIVGVHGEPSLFPYGSRQCCLALLTPSYVRQEQVFDRSPEDMQSLWNRLITARNSGQWLGPIPLARTRPLRFVQVIQKLGRFAFDKLIDQATETLGRYIGIPLNWSDAKDVAICGSITLYSYEMRFVSRKPPPPQAIWHREIDRADRPSRAEFTAELFFNFEAYKNLISQVVLAGTGCSGLPKPGPVSGISVTWETSPELSPHGNLLGPQGTSTDTSGRTYATFQSIDEAVPIPDRTGSRLKSVDGVLSVATKGLLPGWGNLEAIIRAIRANDLPSSIASRLEVNYYGYPGYRFGGVVLHWSVPALNAYGTFEFSPGTICPDSLRNGGLALYTDLEGTIWRASFPPLRTGGSGSWPIDSPEVDISQREWLLHLLEGPPPSLSIAPNADPFYYGGSYDWPKIVLLTPTDDCGITHPPLGR
jgi:hypothetical protein